MGGANRACFGNVCKSVSSPSTLFACIILTFVSADANQATKFVSGGYSKRVKTVAAAHELLSLLISQGGCEVRPRRRLP